jgi:hypothetical protein
MPRTREDGGEAYVFCGLERKMVYTGWALTQWGGGPHQEILLCGCVTAGYVVCDEAFQPCDGLAFSLLRGHPVAVLANPSIQSTHHRPP